MQVPYLYHRLIEAWLIPRSWRQRWQNIRKHRPPWIYTYANLLQVFDHLGFLLPFFNSGCRGQIGQIVQKVSYKKMRGESRVWPCVRNFILSSLQGRSDFVRVFSHDHEQVVSSIFSTDSAAVVSRVSADDEITMKRCLPTRWVLWKLVLVNEAVE